MFAVIVFIFLLYAYSLLSRRLEETILGIPLIFTMAGVLLALVAPRLVRRDTGGEVWLILAEMTYAMVCFNGAIRANVRELKSRMHLTSRLLFVSLPLTVLLGIFASTLALPDLTLWEAGVLACILASTDTSLAALVVSSPRVPGFIREALNAESGLSDGLIIPFLMIFISLIQADTTNLEGVFLRFMVEQIGFGISLGVAIGLVGGWLLGLAIRRGWALASFQQIAIVALVPICWIMARVVDTSPFIAAFCAGISLRTGCQDECGGIAEFSENEGRLLQMFAFFLFGSIAGLSWSEFYAAPVLYAILSLTLVRMLPVAISLIGTRLSAASVLFIGWFGPRGLASIVLGLVVAGQQVQSSGAAQVRLSLIATVLLSIIAHGLTASLGIKLYARKIARFGADTPEHMAVSETPTT